MVHDIPIEVEPGILADYLEELEYAHKRIEQLAIGLEQHPDELTHVAELHRIFDSLLISSSKLDLAPVCESLQDITKSLDSFLQWNVYPKSMSEYLLLLIDRLLLLGRDIQHRLVIDMRRSQNILVSLQYIVCAKDAAALVPNIDKAVEAITREIQENLGELNHDSDTLLFDDWTTEFFDRNTQPVTAAPAAADIFIPMQSKNPLLNAREIIDSVSMDRHLSLLSTISDRATQHGEDHTRFLLELVLATNILAGEPLDTQGLITGVCLHDIELAAYPDIVTKKVKMTEADWMLIKQHPRTGSEVARELFHSDIAAKTILHHHERVDGSGYPDGLSGDNICEEGKLLAIVDSFHAMIDKRPHKIYSKTTFRAIAELNACVGTHYDQHWVYMFNHCIRSYWLPEQKTHTRGERSMVKESAVVYSNLD